VIYVVGSGGGVRRRLCACALCFVFMSLFFCLALLV
jgi:hypothetical protein